jgi:hypothetical protein
MILNLCCTKYCDDARISLFYDEENIKWYIILGEDYNIIKINGISCAILNHDFNYYNLRKINLLNKSDKYHFYIKKNKINDLYLFYNDGSNDNIYIKLPRFLSLKPLYDYFAYFPSCLK